MQKFFISVINGNNFHKYITVCLFVCFSEKFPEWQNNQNFWFWNPFFLVLLQASEICNLSHSLRLENLSSVCTPSNLLQPWTVDSVEYKFHQTCSEHCHAVLYSSVMLALNYTLKSPKKLLQLPVLGQPCQTKLVSLDGNQASANLK